MKAKINGLKFQPWIPESYFDSSNPYGKLLILGESHYINEPNVSIDYSEITTDITKDVINGGGCENIYYYRNLGRVFNINQKLIWEYASFANAIQAAMVDSNAQPTREQFKTIIPALWLIIENLKPQKMIVTSKRMWNNWFPDKDPRCNYVTSIEAKGKESSVWRYKHDNGYCYAIAIKHPSKYFSSEAHKPLIEKFLATDFSAF